MRISKCTRCRADFWKEHAHWDAFACAEGLVRQGDVVHDLAGPGVLDLQGLVVFCSFRQQATNYVDRLLGRPFGSKDARFRDDSFELVLYQARGAIDLQTRGQRARDNKGEGKAVVPSIEGMRVVVVVVMRAVVL